MDEQTFDEYLEIFRNKSSATNKIKYSLVTEYIKIKDQIHCAFLQMFYQNKNIDNKDQKKLIKHGLWLNVTKCDLVELVKDNDLCDDVSIFTFRQCILFKSKKIFCKKLLLMDNADDLDEIFDSDEMVSDFKDILTLIKFPMFPIFEPQDKVNMRLPIKHFYEKKYILAIYIFCVLDNFESPKIINNILRNANQKWKIQNFQDSQYLPFDMSICDDLFFDPYKLSEFVLSNKQIDKKYNLHRDMLRKLGIITRKTDESIKYYDYDKIENLKKCFSIFGIENGNDKVSQMTTDDFDKIIDDPSLVKNF